MFPTEVENPAITFLCIASDNPLAALATNRIFDLCMLKTGNGGTNMGVSRYRYTSDGSRLDNITGWALDQFKLHYEANLSPLAGEGVPAAAGTDEGAAGQYSSPGASRDHAHLDDARETAPSSGASRHLLRQGEKGDVRRGKLLGHARSMRKAPTEAETALWHILRNRRFSGYKFQRQAQSAASSWISSAFRKG